jgi:hypothetical protein
MGATSMRVRGTATKRGTRPPMKRMTTCPKVKKARRRTTTPLKPMTNEKLLGMQPRVVIAIESAIETSNGVDDHQPLHRAPAQQRARDALPLPRQRILQLGQRLALHSAETSPYAPWFAPGQHASQQCASTDRRASRPADAAPLHTPSSTRRVRQALARVGHLPRQRLSFVLLLQLLLLLLLLLTLRVMLLLLLPNRHRRCPPSSSKTQAVVHAHVLQKLGRLGVCKLDQT